MAKEYHTRQTLLYKIIDSSDEKSWDEFVRQYEGYIYVLIRSLGVNQHVAEDLLQDVLIKVWKPLPNYEHREVECTFRTWLWLVIRSTVYNFFKRSRHAMIVRMWIMIRPCMYSIRLQNPRSTRQLKLLCFLKFSLAVCQFTVCHFAL